MKLTAAATTTAAFRAVLGAISADLPAPLSLATLDALLMRGVAGSMQSDSGADVDFAAALRTLHAALRGAVGAERDAAAAAAANAAAAPLVARLAERAEELEGTSAAMTRAAGMAARAQAELASERLRAEELEARAAEAAAAAARSEAKAAAVEEALEIARRDGDIAVELARIEVGALRGWGEGGASRALCSILHGSNTPLLRFSHLPQANSATREAVATAEEEAARRTAEHQRMREEAEAARSNLERQHAEQIAALRRQVRFSATTPPLLPNPACFVAARNSQTMTVSHVPLFG